MMRTSSLLVINIFFTLCIVCCSNGQQAVFPQIPTWKLVQDDPVYDANNLWDIIDGAADLYLEYGFVNLHIGRYIGADSAEIKVELYRHNSAADAFGIYSQERDPAYNFIQVGLQGYLQQGVLNFLTGSSYVKLSTYQTGTSARDALVMIAASVNSYLNQTNAWPKVLQFFPASGRLPNSEQYVARNFLGYSFFDSAYSASYHDSSAGKAFILETRSAESADKVIAEYFKALPKESVTQGRKNRYRILDPHNGLIDLGKQNRYLYGVTNCDNQQLREALMEKLSLNLSQ